MVNWIELNMKFPGKCIKCGQPIPAGQRGLWSKGMGVIHPHCSDDSGDAAEAKIACSVCGKPAGCLECEFQDSCDISRVSANCLCRACSQADGVMSLYRKSVGDRFSVLS